MKDTNVYPNQAIYLLNGDKMINYANAKRLLDRLGFTDKQYGKGDNFLQEDHTYCTVVPDNRKLFSFDGLKVDMADKADPNKPYDYQDINLRYYGLPEVRVEEFNKFGKFNYKYNDLFTDNPSNNGLQTINILIDNANIIDFNKLKACRTKWTKGDPCPLAPVIKEINEPYEFNEYKTRFLPLAMRFSGDGMVGWDLIVDFGLMIHIPTLKKMLDSMIDKTFDYDMLDANFDNAVMRESLNGDEEAHAWLIQNGRAWDDCGHAIGNADSNDYEMMMLSFEDFYVGDDQETDEEYLARSHKKALKMAKTPEEKKIVEDGFKVLSQIDFNQF